MADFDMWGPAASGGRLVDFDRLKASQMLGEIAMQPVEREYKRAATDYTRAHAEELKEKVARTKRLAEMAANVDLTGGKSENPLYDMARIMLNVGDVKEAGDLVNKASQDANRKSQAELRQARIAEVDTKMKIENYDLAAREIGLTTDEASLSTALQNFERRTGTPSGLLDPQTGQLFSGIKFNPNLRQMMVEKLISAKDATNLEERRRHNDILDRHWGAQAQNTEFWQDFDNQRRRAEATRKPSVDKAGGSNLKKADVDAGVAQIMSVYRYDKDDPEVLVKGRQLEERARALVKQQPNILLSDARQQVFAKMQRDGEFGAAKGQGKTIGTSLPIPADKKFKPNTWYDHPTKGPHFFNGSVWLNPQEYRLRGVAPAAAAAAGAGLADDDDDDDKD